MNRLLTILFLLISGYTFSANYFISPSGNNANTGTSTAAPWLTIQYALNHAVAGDVLNVMSGTYTGKLTWNHGGSAGQYIFLQNYNDDIVILDGSTIGNNQALMYLENKDYIKIDGLRFTNHNGSYQPVINTFGNCNHIEISNCEFYSTDCNESYAILCEGRGDDFKIMNNYMHDLLGSNAVGVLFVGSSTSIPFSNILISGNHVQNIAPAPSEAIALNGNINGFEISNNLVEDVNNIGIVMIGGEDWVNTNDAVNFARNGVCKFNTVINANSIYGGGFAGGIYVDGGKDIVIENNSVTGSDIGMEIGCENQGFIAENITVRNNIIYKNEKSGLGFGGYDFPATGQVQNCSFTGNTVVDNDLLNTGFGQLWIQYALNCEVKNNIFYTSTNAWMVNAETIDPTFNIDLNYNDYYYTGGNTNAKFLFDFDYIVGYENYKLATGTDANSITANPLLSNLISPDYDFHLLAISPCINAGDPAYDDAGIDADDLDIDLESRLIGSQVDIGSDEFASLPLTFLNVAVPVTCNASCNGSLTISAIGGCIPYLLEYKAPAMGWQVYTGTLTGLCAGTYKLRATDDCDSVITSSINISQDPVLNLSVTSITNETSPGASNGKINVKATGGYGLKEYSINGGLSWQTSKKFTGLTAGDYLVMTRDAHGCIKTISATVGLGLRLSAINKINIYPNPADDYFIIQMPDVNSEFEIRITDVNGRQVYAKKIQSFDNTSIKLEPHLPAGIYVVLLTGEERNDRKYLVIQ